MKILIILTAAIFAIILVLNLIPKTKNETSISQNENAEIPVNPSWQEHNFEQVNMLFSAPIDTTIDGKFSDETTFELFITRNKNPENNYELHAKYDLGQHNTTFLELTQNLHENTIEETVISDVYSAISGLSEDENKFITYVITNQGILIIQTSPPTDDNKILTEMILDTMYL